MTESAQWADSVKKSILSGEYFAKGYGRAFGENAHLLSQKCSNILWQNALLTQCSFSKEHFSRRAFCQGIHESNFERAIKHSHQIDKKNIYFSFFSSSREGEGEARGCSTNSVVIE